MDAYLNQNRIDEAKTIGQLAIDRKLDSIGVHRNLYVIAVLRKDATEMERQLAFSRGKPEEPFFLANKAITEFSEGKFKLAQETLRASKNLGEKVGMKELAAFLDAAEAVNAGIIGDCSASRTGAVASLQRFPNGFNRAPAFMAMALCGDGAKAKQGIEALASEYPSDTFIRLQHRPLILAVLSMQQGKPDEALALLEPTRRVDIGVGGVGGAAITFAGPYFRGLAYLKKKNGDLAAAEFKKILDARYHDPLNYFIPMAQLQLARAYAMQGDSSKARTAYQDFLASWKDADPDIPILKAAKAEYAKLQ